jgi:CheY-like chemotaxis protein
MANSLSIEVTSIPGQGTRFRVQVPFEFKSNEPDSLGDLSGIQVYVLTANEFMANSLEKMLKVKNASVRILSAPKELRETAAPGILLIDLDKSTTADSARHIEKMVKASLPLVYLTQRHQTPGEEKLGGLRLRKPIKQSQLYSLLAEAAQQRPSAKSKVNKTRLNEALPLYLTKNGAIPVCMVAEDNSINQKVLAGMLGKLGVKCFVVSNGIEALNAVQTVPFDLVFMDCFMPEMDGFEATRHIRKLPGQRGTVPIIAVTAAVLEKEELKCREAGMDAYLPKPVDFQSLQALLGKWFSG